MSVQIPVLMYHKVGATVTARSDTFLNVSCRHFSLQMKLLRRAGYTGITFEHAIAGLSHGKPMPPKPVCVTFDDGHTNVIENALPVLEEQGWPATVFLPTAYAGTENAWDREKGRPLLPIMDWAQLRFLQDCGWEIAGHTRSHPHLDGLDPESAAREIELGRDDIAEHTGRCPRTFCYPFGALNEETPRLVSEAGFVGACTTKSGLATAERDMFRLPRVKVAYRDGLFGLFYRLKIRPHLP
jgi:peptidoglycan/xylan/chitin deacetylase (PgdA/CDA1 family)